MLKKFVKTTAIIGAVMTTLGVTTPVSAASCGTVTANSLYVRSGASTSHNILGTVICILFSIQCFFINLFGI